jgi:hypothetical protein
MEQSPSTEADISSASQEIPTFYINKMFVTVLKEPELEPDKSTPHPKFLFL